MGKWSGFVSFICYPSPFNYSSNLLYCSSGNLVTIWDGRTHFKNSLHKLLPKMNGNGSLSLHHMKEPLMKAQRKSMDSLRGRWNLNVVVFFLCGWESIRKKIWKEASKDTVDGSEFPNNHLGCIKPCKQWDIYHINWIAGFLPSTVWCNVDFCSRAF